MAKTVQQAVDNWVNGAGAAQQRYVDGVRSTDVDVIGRAIAQAPVAMRNYATALSSGLWARRLTESGGTANWKTQTEKKAGNYGTGIAAAKDKFTAAMQHLLPYIQQGRGQIHSMPKGSLADSKARATAWIDYMAAYRANR